MTVKVHRSGAMGMVRDGAYYGATVWAMYGIVETAVVISGPVLKRVLPTAVTAIFPSLSPYTSPSLTALVLSIYPLVGALIGAAVGGLLAFTSSVRRAGSGSDGATLWSAIGILIFAIAFGVNALVAQQVLVLPAVLVGAVLGVLRLTASLDARSSWRRSALTCPLTILLVIVGLAFAAQPRPFLSPIIPLLGGLTYVGAVLAVAAFLERLWRVTPERVTRWLPRHGGGLVLFACAALVSTIVTDNTPRDLRQPRQGPGVRGRPNIILITLDTVRADHLSVYGYGADTTPNLRRLVAGQAVAYWRSISSSNWTLPSHAALFTGQTASHSEGHDSCRGAMSIHPISERSRTLPELLAREGYRTGAAVANTGVLTPALGFARGFASFNGVELHDFFSPTGRPYLFRESVREIAAAALSPMRAEATNAPAGLVNDLAERFLESGPQPFFLFLNYLDAHVPYTPPHPFEDRFPGRNPRFHWADYDAIVEAVSVSHVRRIDASESAHLVSQYDGAIAYMDYELGRLFQRLKSLDLFENTLIIITSDHGEAFGESSVVGHRRSLYQHQVHVPLIVKYPRALSGGRNDELTSGVDILPTVLDVIGAPAAPDIDGISLRKPEKLRTRWVATESFEAQGSRLASSDGCPSETALFQGNLKLIVGAGGAAELYDLSSDPAEQENVIGDRMVPRELISKLVSDMKEGARRPNAPPVADPELLERLRALGYIR